MHASSRPLVKAALVAGLLAATAAGTPARALNDPEYNRQWGMQVIGAKTAWDAGIMGQGIDIAVVDTGVHLGHQDLAPNIGAGRDFVNNDDRGQDDESHGTHVAGIAAAAIDNGGTVGVAPRARIMPVKVLASDGSGSGDDVAAGIRWAVDNGAEIINLSLGEDTQALFGPSTEEAVRYAWSKGSICVFAAGNDFILSSGFADEPALVVASTSRGDRISYFSNGVGSARWGLSAPGGPAALFQAETESIFSTTWLSDARRDTYGYKSGTSMAAPHVAGAAALLRGAGLSPQQTVDRLLSTAKDLGSAGRDNTYGAGRLDVAKAVQGLAAGPAPGSAPNPGPTTATPAPAPAPAASPTTAQTRTTSGPKAAPAATPGAPAPAPAPEAPVETTVIPPAPEASAEVAVELPPASLPAPASSEPDDVPVPLVALAAVALAGAGGGAWLTRRRVRAS